MLNEGVDDLLARGRQVISAEVAQWCFATLGSPVSEVFFEAGHLGQVYGMELADGRRVAVKVRPAAERVFACWAVQEHLFAADFPCPRPIAGPARIGSTLITAEEFIDSAAAEAPTAQTLPRYAELLCRLVRSAPPHEACGDLSPAPPWIGWDHTEPGTWPIPDDLECDLNEIHGPAWIEDAGLLARACLQAAELPPVIGHMDWESHNLAWRHGQPVAVFDWDSVAARPEAAIAGAAGAVFPSFGETVAASLTQNQHFLDEYQAARDRPFISHELRVAWAAGTWVLAYNAKKESTIKSDGPYQHVLITEVTERLSRAGA